MVLTVKVASSGPAASHQATRMGNYEKMEDFELNDKPVYKHVDSENYLFFSAVGSGHWLVLYNNFKIFYYDPL